MQKQLIIILLSVGLFACSNKTESANTIETPAATETAATGTGNGDCIMGYQRKLDELLTLDMIKKHYTGDLSKAELKYNKSSPERKADTDKCIYAWESDRIRTVNIGGNSMKLPIDNEVGVKWVGSDLFMMSKSKSALENFKAFYRNASKEEKEKAFAIAEKAVKQKEGVSKETADAATGIAKGMASDDIIFENITGIGDAASWRIKDNYLIVLAGNTTFQIVADVDKDNRVNLELAKKLALEVLAKCK